MTSATVLQVGEVPPSIAETLSEDYRALVLPSDAQRDVFLAARGESVRVVVDAGQVRVDAALMDALPNLGAIIHYGAGYDTVDIDAARDRGIGVSNTPDVLTDTTADTALGLILMTLRGLTAADRYVRAGRWPRDGAFPYGRDVHGARVGILGLGRIGSAIAHRLAGFDCDIAYHNRREVPGSPYRHVASLRQLAHEVDVLVIAAGGERGAPPLVDREVLEALGPEGYLINIGRGSVVDEDALVELLAQGRLAGAGLDVFAHEPWVPPQLCEMDNVVVLPHVGSATAPTRAAMCELVLSNLAAYLTSNSLITSVVPPTR